METEMQAVLLALGAGWVGWVTKEVASIVGVKENVSHIRSRVDAISDHLLGTSHSGPEEG